MKSGFSIKGNYPLIVQKLWIIYFLDFIYSGILRGFLLSQFSNVLYFVRAAVVLLLLIIFLQSGKLLGPFSRFFVFLAVLLSGFQLILFVNSQITILGLFYGLYLYVIPLLGVAMAESINLRIILSKYFSILKIALPINLLVSILQTVFKFTQLYSAGFGTGLYSSNGIQRATGTFSSSVGLSLFLTISFILLVGVYLLDIRVIPIYIWLHLFFLVLISGSRTTIFNLGFLFLATFFMRGMRLNFYTNRVFSKILWGLFSLFIVTFPLVSPVYFAGLNRFTSANEIDPPLSRLFAQLTFENYRFSLFGEGLGTRALGSVNNSDRRVLFAEWIEFDNARILVEAGVFFLLLIWFSKILFILRVMNARSRLTFYERTFLDVGLIGLCPYLLFAQIFGQGTISSGVFLLMYLLLSLISGGHSSSDRIEKKI